MGKRIATSLTTAPRGITITVIAECLAEKTGLKKSACLKVLKILAETVTREFDRAGNVVLPGVCMFKTRVKPAAPAGKRHSFGQQVMCNATRA